MKRKQDELINKIDFSISDSQPIPRDTISNSNNSSRVATDKESILPSSECLEAHEKDKKVKSGHFICLKKVNERLLQPKLTLLGCGMR